MCFFDSWAVVTVLAVTTAGSTVAFCVSTLVESFGSDKRRGNRLGTVAT